ncbi:helicase-primase complex component [Saguinine gammaherpesvirus 1]|uniref:Helicase-primase complex component n=1 Tax=Saguinine gammaherpesvirus 1 TaxID=2169901 RepID=A0A9Q8VHD7_9GAMA|nr:helicase-primase complex component [Saguinine gammaherpesvirus 1]
MNDVIEEIVWTLSLDRKDLFFCLQSRAVFLLQEGNIFTSVGDRDVPNQPISWIQSINYGLQMALSEEHDLHTADIIDDIFHIYNKNKHISGFWFLPGQMVTKTMCPHLPLDCLEPVCYLMSTQGAIPWHQQMRAPLNLDYTYYIDMMIQVLRNVFDPDRFDKDKIDTFLNLNKILSLL